MADKRACEGCRIKDAMVKRAILSDIHGNLEALTAVLADAESQGVTQWICLGDVVGYGPNPLECIERIMQFDVCVLGNHDLGALFDPEGFSSGAEHAIFWTRTQLEADYGRAGDRPGGDSISWPTCPATTVKMAHCSCTVRRATR